MRSIRRSFVALTSLLALLALSFSPFAAAAEESGEDPLSGKSVLFVGDSICEAICEMPYGRWPYGREIVGWAGRIIYAHDMTGKNLGLSGASLSDCRGTNIVTNQLVREKGNVYDYVIMQGGANDAWDSAPVGEMAEGFEGPYDLTTFAGGLEEMFRYAKEAFPDAQLGFIINFQLPMGSYGRLSDMSEYMDLAVEICEKWEIPYLDLYHDEAFNEELMVTTNTYLHDYIHPNGEGYDVIAPHVEEWLLEIASGDYVFPSQEVSSEEPVSEEESSEATAEAGSVSGESEASAAEETASKSVPWGAAIALGAVVAVAAAGITFAVLKSRAKE